LPTTGKGKNGRIAHDAATESRTYPVAVVTAWIAPDAVTIFTSATLLFLIQPSIAKQLLPWFGGAAAVWATCLVFFQCLLLLGYLYAHLLIRNLSCKFQVLVHVLLLATSVVVVFLPGHSQQHTAESENRA
jgi:hypothetical protein